MAEQNVVTNDENLLKSDIDNILYLFKDKQPYISILDLRIDSEIKSTLDFFIFHQQENTFTEAHDIFETHFKNNKDVFLYYQKWYVVVNILLRFVNKDQEQVFINGKTYNDKKKIDKLKKVHSLRYKHFGAWITD